MGLKHKLSRGFDLLNRKLDIAEATAKRKLAEEKKVKVKAGAVIDKARVRAERQLKEARTKADREKALLALKRAKLEAQREVYEARVATQKAQERAEQARKAAGDLTLSERFSKFSSDFGKNLGAAYKGLTRPAPRKRSATRRAARGTTRR